VIPYHGLPIWPASTAYAAINGGHAFVSHRRPDQVGLAIEVCQSIAIDNGAFSAWKSGEPVTDWSRYYEWIAYLHRVPVFDFAVIPDVIDGGEDDNDALVAEWPWQDSKTKWVGAPVWHMHESIDRLVRLANEWPRICIGSSGAYATVGNDLWWQRMAEAMNEITDREGLPICKIHGLRMLNPEVFTRLPFSSADSTNIAQNVGIDQKWKGTYSPASKDIRAVVMRERIETNQSATHWERQPIQAALI
jgi:hypothetical protein